MKTIIIKTQKELDNLLRVEKDQEVYIKGEGLRLNKKLEVYGFLKIETKVDMDWGRNIELRESSHAVLWGSSHAVLWESSHAVLWDSSVSWLYSTSVKISLFGWSVAYKLFEGKGNISIERKTARVIEVPPQDGTFEDFVDRYPVEQNGKTATLYKAVHKDKDGYYSDYDNRFRYEIGQIYEHVCEPAEKGSCAVGLHVSHKSWARAFGASWGDFALLECEVAVKDIVVSKDTDGKVRCSKLKVVREVPNDEWF